MRKFEQGNCVLSDTGDHCEGEWGIWVQAGGDLGKESGPTPPMPPAASGHHYEGEEIHLGGQYWNRQTPDEFSPVTTSIIQV